MTLASELITRAYRESNLVSLAGGNSTAQQTEALPLLNSLLLSTVGNEAGDELCDLPIGGEYDRSHLCTNGVPANARLVLNLAAATTLLLHPNPYDGQRIAVADAAANLNTRNLILSGNGRRIETAASVTLNTASLSRQWMYRADAGNWVRITDLVAADTMPFPTEFDDYFVTRLAMRLNPRYGQALPAETIAALERAEQQMQARYRQRRPQQDIGSLGLLGQGGLYPDPNERQLYG